MHVHATQDGMPQTDLVLSVNNQKVLLNTQGFATLTLPSGEHLVEVSQLGDWVGEFTVNASNDVDVLIDMIGGEAVAESSASKDQSGVLSGVVRTSDGDALEGAIISAGDHFATSQADGSFSIEAPSGGYTLSVGHPDYVNQNIKGVRVFANQTLTLGFTMATSNDSDIEEVLAVNSYNPNSVTSQERDSSSVLDSIGAEQLSRFGDSNAASALKRVAGVSISGGKYVLVRGLGERHSTIMLNGASLPSPDPTRRVVPLDIFPSNVLQTINVQKSFTPNVYADSTGGTVTLKTKKFPEEFEGKLSVKIGFLPGLTLNQRTLQPSETWDFLGIGANGDRKLPDLIERSENQLAQGNLTPDQREQFANALPHTLSAEERTILPDTGLQLSLGDLLFENPYWAAGYAVSLKYSNTWSKEDSERATYIVNGGRLSAKDQFNYIRTVNDIDLGVGLTLGAIYRQNEITWNAFVLRQTEAETSNIQGIVGDQGRNVLRTNMNWSERSFSMQQLMGEHALSDTTQLAWQMSLSGASLDSPDERSYSFEGGDGDPFILFLSTADRVYTTLDDDNKDISLDISTEAFSTSAFTWNVGVGGAYFTRQRDAKTIRLGYSDKSGGSNLNDVFEDITDIDTVINKKTIAAQAISLRSETLPADSYTADWSLSSIYLTNRFSFFDWIELEVGARYEDSTLQVNTFTVGSTIFSPLPVTALIEDKDVFATLNATFNVTDNWQIKSAFYQTKNRPDFRELSNSAYVDPVDGDTVRGNPELTSTMVNNFDARLAYFLSESESISLSYFKKDFEAPIERTLLTGGEVFSFDNGEYGKTQGIEIDANSTFDLLDYGTFSLGGNITFIDSEVAVVVDTERKVQSMQGQPDTLFNVQLGYDEPSGQRKYTLVYNRSGASIYAVSERSLPNVVRESRGELNFNVSQIFNYGLSAKLNIKNITNEPVDLTQGGKRYRFYKKGVRINLSASWQF